MLGCHFWYCILLLQSCGTAYFHYSLVVPHTSTTVLWYCIPLLQSCGIAECLHNFLSVYLFSAFECRIIPVVWWLLTYSTYWQFTGSKWWRSVKFWVECTVAVIFCRLSWWCRNHCTGSSEAQCLCHSLWRWVSYVHSLFIVFKSARCVWFSTWGNKSLGHFWG